jgi:hypothetical protein
MPAKPPAVEPDPVPLGTAPDSPPAADPAPEPETPAGRLPAGTYAYTDPNEALYLEVPLTARPTDGDRPATVFAWPFGAPDDGRWKATRSKPNQGPDNDPAAMEE